MEAGGAEVCISGGISSVCGLKKKEERGKKERNSIVPRKIKPKAVECKGLQLPCGRF